jgi:transposase-like protein
MPMITTMHSDQNASPPRVEVITSVQRHRRWPTAEKIRLVEETMQPGMSVSYVARRAGVAPSLLFTLLRHRSRSAEPCLKMMRRA